MLREAKPVWQALCLGSTHYILKIFFPEVDPRLRAVFLVLTAITFWGGEYLRVIPPFSRLLAAAFACLPQTACSIFRTLLTLQSLWREFLDGERERLVVRSPKGFSTSLGDSPKSNVKAPLE
jgi:hypothetical protein